MYCPWSRPWERKMDSVQFSMLLFGLVLVLSVQTGYSEDVMCSVCNSAPQYEGDKCADPFTSTDEFVRNCTEIGQQRGLTYKYCRKIVQNVEGEDRVVRQCATDGRVGECVDRTGTKAIKIKYCECEGPNCNSGSVFSISMILLAVSSALLALICHS